MLPLVSFTAKTPDENVSSGFGSHCWKEPATHPVRILGSRVQPCFCGSGDSAAISAFTASWVHGPGVLPLVQGVAEVLNGKFAE